MDQTRWRAWMKTRGPRFIAIAEKATMFDVPVKQMPRREVIALLGYLLVKAKAEERRGTKPRRSPWTWMQDRFRRPAGRVTR